VVLLIQRLSQGFTDHMAGVFTGTAAALLQRREQSVAVRKDDVSAAD
jgi:hypothetical protein